MSPYLLLPLLWACFTQAAKITGWNPDNVVFDTGVHTPGEVYYNHIFEVDTSPALGVDTSHGGILWKEESVKEPGMKVVTQGDGGESCVMTSGFNPFSPSDAKQCTDEFQSSKRFKRYSQSAAGSVDVVFDIEPFDGPIVYRVFEKYENLLTDQRVSKFEVELGTGIGDSFVASTNNDGLAFTTANGDDLAGADSEDKDLAAFFAFGLFGDALVSAHHDVDGYYDPTNRASFTLTATEDRITADQVSANMAGLYDGGIGSWLSKDQVPYGFFFDHDNDEGTEAVTLGDWNGEYWQTYRLCSDPVFDLAFAVGLVAADDCRSSTSDSPKEIAAETILKWRQSGRFARGPIEDIGNVNLNYHIKVDDTFTTEGNAKFTLRVTPFTDTSTPPETPWLDDLPQCDFNILGVSSFPGSIMHQNLLDGSGRCVETCALDILAFFYELFGWNYGPCEFDAPQ